MKCHYEVLNLERDADDSQIKAAYRKLALRWHPDKNLADPEGAKEQFQLVQQAYEVLSDPQERAWYDNHREQILRGGHTNYEDNSLDVFQYFTASCYKGFSDEPGGFYAVYAEVFDKIAAEDIEYMDSEKDFDLIPKFGNSTSDYEEVVHTFYAYWQSYCTKKSYAWLCPHNINEIRDRRILKVIEKENKKVQQKARKERNEEIRNLVAFVRKRDKRVQAYRKILEERVTQNRLKQAQSRLEQIRKRNEEIEEQKKTQGNFFNEGYEQQLRQLEESYVNEYGNSEDEYTTDDDQDEKEIASGVDEIQIETNENLEDLNCDEFYCVACNKAFKNQSSYRNHETSKKHRENIQQLKNEMKEEEAAFTIKEKQETNIPINNGAHDTDSDQSDEMIITKQKSKKTKKKTQNPIAVESEEEAEIDVGITKSDDEDDWNEDVKKSSKKSKIKNKPSSNKKLGNTSKTVETPKLEESIKILKEKEPEPTTSSSIDVNHSCVTCKEIFSSKNKLFNHLKKTNHGVYIPKVLDSEGSGKKGKKKK